MKPKPLAPPSQYLLATDRHRGNRTTHVGKPEDRTPREFLEAHNAYRQDHGAPPLTLSRELCVSAQSWSHQGHECHYRGK
uniref:SCP domain-containing protein n=1 Tax=Paramormyrops kingsleyae TaxID=1676925 RepID=A0A3B3QFJ8_9TELE